MERINVRDSLDQIEMLRRRYAVLQTTRRVLQAANGICAQAEGSEIDNELADCAERIEEAKVRAAVMITRLEDPRMMEIMAGRYLDGMSWEAVAKKAGVRKAYAYKLHGAAIQKMQAVAEKNAAK